MVEIRANLPAQVKIVLIVRVIRCEPAGAWGAAGIKRVEVTAGLVTEMADGGENFDQIHTKWDKLDII